MVSNGFAPYRVEVIGAFAAAKSVLPGMSKRSRGSVFFSSATAAFRGSNTHPLYAIGKFGLRALSESLSVFARLKSALTKSKQSVAWMSPGKR